jgi:hypothetical protein
MAFSTYAEAVAALRRHLNDLPQLNTLDRDLENTDDELEDDIKFALMDINHAFEPMMMFTIADVAVEPGVDTGRVPWSLLKDAAILQILQQKGIISARNALTYSDAGGVQVNEMDKWGRYLNYFNVLAGNFDRKLMNLKRRQNIQAVWGGGTNSPMGWDYYYG